jgi:hypothetical protein
MTKRKIADIAAEITPVQFSVLRFFALSPARSFTAYEFINDTGFSLAAAELAWTALSSAGLIRPVLRRGEETAFTITYEGRAVFEYLREAGTFSPGRVLGLDIVRAL